MKNIIGFLPKEFEEEMIEAGEKAYRARQIISWIYKKRAFDFQLMTDLPQTLIKKLAKHFEVTDLLLEQTVVSRTDGAEKFLWKLSDENLIESVLIRAKERNTICVSTQVGCKTRCLFCESGKNGFKRDLTDGEIVGQIMGTIRETKCDINNVVFMGMGEPLDNYKNLERAIQIINHPDCLNIGARKMTVSTCGIVPGIRQLSELGIQVELAISLHAGNDELRNELVPINRKYPIAQLIEACQFFSKITGRKITIEYAVIKGKNDSGKDAREVAGIAKEINAKVNLIGCNKTTKIQENACTTHDVERFRDLLLAKGVPVTVRRSRGSDIFAACGQLSAHKVKNG